MKKSILKTILILVSVNYCLHDSYAQGENDNWIFGYGCYISFKTGTPEVKNNLNTLSTDEGCTSVSNKKGDLLFYSDGTTIWTKEHLIMDKGKGLLGNYSSTSSCVIVPFPGHPLQYFVFCNDAARGWPNKGLSYNIIDLSFHNGLGKVVVKNETLLEATDEKIAVTRHCNGKDFWILTHHAGTPDFYAYLLTNLGISKNPVITPIPESFSNYTETGYLKFSPNGNWLVNTQSIGQKLEIYRFNKSKGEMTLYAIDKETFFNSKPSCYGVAFSATSEKLYVSNLAQGQIFQYSMIDKAGDILNNKIFIAGFNNRIGALQLGKDNLIYVSDGDNSSYLHIIRHPELKGALCGFERYALKLNIPGTGQLGLPTYVESMEKYFSIKKDSLINQDGYILDASINNAVYEWSTGETTKSITVFKTGKYWVKVLEPNTCYLLTDTIQIDDFYRKITISNPESDTISVCENETIKIPVFFSDTDNVSFFWMNSNSQIGLPSFGTGQIGSFTASKTDSVTKATITVYPHKGNHIGIAYFIHITVNPGPEILKGTLHDTAICGGTLFKVDTFKSISNNVIFNWRNNNSEIGLPSSGIGQINSFLTGKFHVDKISLLTVTPQLHNCVGDSEVIRILLKAIPVTAFQPDIEVCNNRISDPILLRALPLGSNVNWISENPDFEIPHIGKNEIPSFNPDRNTADLSTNIICVPESRQCTGDTSVFKITVVQAPVASFDYKIKDSLDNTFSTIIQFDNLSLNSSEYDWDFGDNQFSAEKNPLHTFNKNGCFRVILTVENDNGCSDSFSKMMNLNYNNSFYIPNSFSPDHNSRNEGFRIYTNSESQIQFRIYDRWGEKIFSTMTNEIWNGEFNNIECPEGVYLYIVKATDYKNKEYEFSGTVTLLR